MSVFEPDPLGGVDAHIRADGSDIYFGRDVLRGLLDGIDRQLDEFASRRRSAYVIGPAMIACSPWFTDRELLTTIGRLKGACVLVGKRPRSAADWRIVSQMREHNDQHTGLPVRAFSELRLFEPPDEDGQARVIGPYADFDNDYRLPVFRTIGHRSDQGERLSLVHAKLALLGELWWSDDADYGTDVVGFRNKRLWVSSANFTQASRGHVEFGYWTTDQPLMASARQFLLGLAAASEDFDTPHKTPSPELVEAEIDFEAIEEVAIEHLRSRHEDSDGDDGETD